MILTDIVLIVLVGYAAYVGARRGFVLVTLELISFILAACVAFAVYRPLGSWLVGWTGVSLSLGNVTAFVVSWVVVELACALAVRLLVMPRLTARVQFALANRIGGSISGALRAILLLAFGLLVLAGLPISAATKQPITGSAVARLMLGATSGWQDLIATGLGHDLGASLTIFTVKADPESTERIPLGFTTTQVKVDPAAEDRLLQLVNHERTSRGLKALTINQSAQQVARAYGTRMFADGMFSHIDNDGHNPFDRMRAGGVKFGNAGENLALAPTLELAHQGLMNSPGHKANILSTSYRAVGIGVVDGGRYGIMVVQDFTD